MLVGACLGLLQPTTLAKQEKVLGLVFICGSYMILNSNVKNISNEKCYIEELNKKNSFLNIINIVFELNKKIIF
jgi:hypothetical protein